MRCRVTYVLNTYLGFGPEIADLTLPTINFCRLRSALGIIHKHTVGENDIAIIKMRKKKKKKKLIQKKKN